MKLGSIAAIARSLNGAHVSCIVVGGLAVNAHGYARMTQDLDLVVKLAPESVQALFSALGDLGYRPRVPVTAEGFADRAQREQWMADKGMMVLNFHSDLHRETPIDVFVAEPFDFDREFQRALVEEITSGVSLRIVALPTLLRLKRAAGRPQDLADVAELTLLHGEVADD